MRRLVLAIKTFFAVLFGKQLPAAVAAQPLAEPIAATTERPAPVADAVQQLQLIALLQKEGRLIDFLKEPLDAYDDAQIGSAVRNIHRDCRRVLEEHCKLEPVLEESEEATVTLDEGFDPSRVRLIGNVSGQPPFSGVVRHRGWRVASLDLPAITAKGDLDVVAPAEVELN